jgi:hypothetical protein
MMSCTIAVGTGCLNIQTVSYPYDPLKLLPTIITNFNLLQRMVSCYYYYYGKGWWQGICIMIRDIMRDGILA